MWKKYKLFESLTPFSLLDYHGKTSAILWFSGCDMRCSFCYNPQIVNSKGNFSYEDFSTFLKSRINLIKGIVLCGGEPTIHPEIINIAKELKKLGYKIKLDTNGLHPTIIKKLIGDNLIDFLALDFKAPKYKFHKITKAPLSFYDKFLETLEILIASDLDFEVRTTFCDKLLNIEDIENIFGELENLNFKGNYYLQNFIEGKTTLDNITTKNTIDISKELKDINRYNFSISFRNF